MDPVKSALAIATLSASASPTDAATTDPSPSQEQDPYVITDRTPPALSEVASEANLDGAEAYAYFLFEAWSHAIQTNDVAWWRDNTEGSAPWLESIARVLESGASAGTAAQVADFHPYTVRRGTNPNNADEHVVVLRAEIDTIYEVSSAGDKTVDTPAMLTEFAVILSYGDNGWIIVDAQMTQAQGQQ